ncbi:MAG: hypothetical protein G01um101472_632 [Parcubacteria group bacterium Gr01-1014_72]|nr:MAG: hypothetical protein G01um101472_632 [Parcubacteria group bacterium Gr01-1014_72]
MLIFWSSFTFVIASWGCFLLFLCYQAFRLREVGNGALLLFFSILFLGLSAYPWVR